MKKIICIVALFICSSCGVTTHWQTKERGYTKFRRGWPWLECATYKDNLPTKNTYVRNMVFKGKHIKQ